MKYDLDSSRHAVFTLNYHLIICTKFRKKIITKPEIINRIKEVAKYISNKFDVEILNPECDKDHIHILFKAKPKTELTKFINSLKGVTARYVLREFPEVKKKVGNHLWSPSYCLITTGQVTLDQLKKYVESQGK